MPVLTPPTPGGLRRAFEEAGFVVVDEDALNWVMARPPNGPPFNIPKAGARVGVGVTDKLIHHPFADARLKRAIMDAVSRDAAIPDPPEQD